MLGNSVKVDDYFGNDENGLWAWYLCNLRHGNFEELNNNQLKVALLRRFLNEQLMSETVPFNKKLLLVSIPDAIHENTNLLENFLRDYFHLDDLQYIQIQKLTQDQCYNHENHYLICDNLSNFNDKSFLEFGAKSRTPRNETTSQLQSSGNQYSIISGETGFDSVRSSVEPRTIPRDSRTSKVIQEDPSTVNMPSNSTRSLTVEKSESVSSDDDGDINIDDYEDEDDGGSELVLQFKHHSIQRKPWHNPDVHNKLSAGIQTSNTSSTGISLRSEDVSSYEGEALTQTITREDDSGSPFVGEDSISELSSVDHSLRSLSYDSEYSQGSSSMTSIFPSLSISEKFGRFRLVLQSILIQQPDTRQLITAVRQSNNDPTVAHVNDDWLLYDEKFSMNNLQMLALHDVLEMNKFFPKVLFYTLVMIQEDVAVETQDYQPNGSHLSPKATISVSTLSEHTLRLESTFASTYTNTNSFKSDTDFENSVSPFGLPAQFVDDNAEDDRNDIDKSGKLYDGEVVQLFAATRTNSDKSTAHRSIRTIKSIGDWAFHHDSTPKQIEFTSPSSAERDHQLSDNKLIKVKSKSSVKSGLTKSLTLGSLSTVERSKSVPLPSILKTLSNFDEEALYLKRQVAKFKRKRSAKRKKNDPKCVLM
ncbi:LANO_0D03532g1_1 [Lachancea nothofagi CBS 11611]|uniref:LANO_0D03532g1_1 n=1 Tax=Lachancea nothofagi CBS 11611 TaxID=1266666 RepID=A0A1G4JFB9_9SACH|nr:LANO_0D03532g1_1 [Lachancea nothofagi CBS 11611]